ncbi:MAG: TIGR02449 family protein, partial [Chitinophagaceae bacterium]
MTPSEQHIARLQEKLLLLVRQQQRLRSENAELRQQLAQATDDRQALA